MLSTQVTLKGNIYLANFCEKRCRYLRYLVRPDSGLVIRISFNMSDVKKDNGMSPHDLKSNVCVCEPDNTQAAGLDRLSSTDRRTRQCWNSIHQSTSRCDSLERNNILTSVSNLRE